MPRFRPQRQFGQWLLRALGAIDHLTGRQISSLEWESTVIPTVEVGSGSDLPGLVAIPRREVWSFSEDFAAVAAQKPRIQIYSAPATFSTSDPRTASGVFILDWRVSHGAGVIVNPPTVRYGVPIANIANPGAPGAGRVTPLWGQSVAAAAITADTANRRTPRAQCHAATQAGSTTDLTDYPALLHNDRGTLYTGTPLYVPVGSAFVLEPGILDVNVAMAMSVSFVEAEEVPFEVPLR